MILTFRAKKMIDRIKAEGRGHMLDEKTLATINSLDGKKANTYNWASTVHGEPLAYISPEGDFPGMYVNEKDCD